MEIQVQAVGFRADQKLIDFATSRVEKLTHFSENIVNAEVFFRLDNTTNVDYKVAEVKLIIPGNDLFAKKQCKSFEEAIDESVDALKKQIEKIKGKQQK
mgnify:CR=1 FL=1